MSKLPPAIRFSFFATTVYFFTCSCKRFNAFFCLRLSPPFEIPFWLFPIPFFQIPCINVNKVWASARYYKEIPPGASEPVVWDRCNYSDNIRKSALPPLGSSLLGWKICGFGWGTQLPCTVLHWPLFHLHFAHFGLLLFLLSVFFVSSMRMNCIFVPTRSLLFSVVYKVEFFSSKMEIKRRKITLLLCSCWLCPHALPLLLTVSPKQDRCSVCMPPALPSSIFLPGIPDYCGICLIALSECLLFVRSDVLEGSAPSKMSLSATTRSVSSRYLILESAQKIYNSFLSCGYCNQWVKRVLVLLRGVVINKDF